MVKSEEKKLEEHLQVISAFLNQIITFRNQFADYVGKWELYEHLTGIEVEFMNDISIACQKYADEWEMNRQLTNAEKEEMK